jgi:hypothetical protein
MAQTTMRNNARNNAMIRRTAGWPFRPGHKRKSNFYNFMKMPFLSTRIILKKTTYAAFLLTATMFIAACSDDDENPFAADVQKVVGTYAVEDTDEGDEVETYSISIAQSNAGGPNLEISNFGDIMYVPVKALIKGNTLTVPPQTFTGKTMTIIISGQGTLNGSTLNFDYTIETDDDYLLEHSCVAAKQNN